MVKTNKTLKRNKRFVGLRLDAFQYDRLAFEAAKNHRTVSGEIRSRILSVTSKPD